MALLSGIRQLNRSLRATAELLNQVDSLSGNLERRNPLGRGEVEIAIVGPDGKPLGGGKGPGAQFAASEIRPVGPDGRPLPPGSVPIGPDMKNAPVPLPGYPWTPDRGWETGHWEDGKWVVGDSGSKQMASSKQGGPLGKRVKVTATGGLLGQDGPTEEQKAAAANVIISNNIVPPRRSEWASTGKGAAGTTNSGNYYIIQVATLGMEAPPQALKWVAGWVAFVYSQEMSGMEKASSHSTPGARGTGGGDRPWHEAPRQGEVDPNAFGQRGAIDPNTWYNQGRSGGSPSSLFTKSIADGTQKQVGQLEEVVKELKTLNKKINNNGSIGFRAEGVP